MSRVTKPKAAQQPAEPDKIADAPFFDPVMGGLEHPVYEAMVRGNARNISLHGLVELSIAISLKRIADHMDQWDEAGAMAEEFNRSAGDRRG